MNEATSVVRAFERLADGSYVWSEFSSGLWIRSVEKHGDHFVHVDGTGERHRYRLVPLQMTDNEG